MTDAALHRLIAACDHAIAELDLQDPSHRLLIADTIALRERLMGELERRDGASSVDGAGAAG